MKITKQCKTFGLLLLLGLLLASSAGLQAARPSYPIAPEILTTDQRTIIPDPIPPASPKIFPYEIAKYKEYGYGSWHYGPGLNRQKRLDLMPANYKNDSVTKTVKLLNFFTITDIHITDKETPAQAVFFGYKGGVSSGYSGIMLYTTHVLDAAVQTINALHQKNRFNFGISLGDTCNNTQYNELRWYIDVLDGRKIKPDSGAMDDPVFGPLNDYQDEYQPAGLDKSIPWYQTMGNHDHFWMGFLPPNDYIRKTLTGKQIINLGNPFVNNNGPDSRGFYLGALDGRTIYGDIIGCGPEKEFATPPQVLAADANRRSLKRQEWIGQFFNTTSSPKGHGFSPENAKTGFACYTFEPKSKFPLKVIALDDTQRNDEPNVRGYGHVSLDKPRYEWLVKELDKGQAEGKLMIIAAHEPIAVEPAGSFMAWTSPVLTEKQFLAKLHTYPNLILWIAGHRHINTVTALPSPDPKRPELGFWEVETCSLRDFPQQFRTFEIFRNSDNTISTFVTDVDPAVSAGSMADTSRSYAVAAQMLFANPLPAGTMPTGSYNAELLKQLSPQMQAKMKKAK